MKREEQVIEGLLEIREAMESDWEKMFELFDKFPRAAGYIQVEKFKNSYLETAEIQLYCDIAMQAIMDDAVGWDGALENLICRVDSYTNSVMFWGEGGE